MRRGTIFQKKQKKLGLIICIAMLITGCGTTDTQYDTDTQNTIEASETTEVWDEDWISLTGDYSERALASDYEEETAIKIDCDTTELLVDGVITISQEGTYILTGTLEDGQIMIEVPEDENVQLVLDHVTISCSDNAAIYVLSAKNVFLTLAQGSDNTISDGDTNITEDSEESTNAAIYSKSDLIINGTGSLTVNGNYRDGITSKDDLEIISGIITVNAVDDAIVGKDSISMCGGTLNLIAGGDGLKSSNIDDSEKGYVVIDEGDLTISAGDDGIHSETALVINGGTLQIADSLEGLESLNIIINGGTIEVNASDDGINVSGGIDTVSSDTPGVDQAIQGVLQIYGGTITVTAAGDGLDSNGDMLIAGGITTVYGPTDGGNGVIDYNGTFREIRSFYIKFL